MGYTADRKKAISGSYTQQRAAQLEEEAARKAAAPINFLANQKPATNQPIAKPKLFAKTGNDLLKDSIKTPAATYNPLTDNWFSKKVVPVLDVITGGIQSALGNKDDAANSAYLNSIRKTTTGNKVADVALGGVGQAIGFMGMPGMGGIGQGNIAQGLSDVTKLTEAGLTRLAPNLMAKPIVGKMLQGAVESIPFTAQQSYVQGMTPEETAKTAGMNAALGGALGGVVGAIPGILKKLKAKIPLTAEETAIVQQTPELSNSIKKPIDTGVSLDSVVNKVPTFTEDAMFSAPKTYNKPLNNTLDNAALNAEDFGSLSAKPPKPIKEVIAPEPISPDTVLPDPQSKIVFNKQAPKKSFKEAWNNFYTRTVDTANPAKKVGEEFYTKTTNSKSVNGIVDNNIINSLSDVNGNKVGEPLKYYADQIPKGKEDDFWTYMSQRDNIDRAREGKNAQANYTPEMSAEAVRRYEAANPDYKKIGDGFIKFQDDFMQKWGVDTGIVNKELYATLKDKYKSHIPLQRDMSELENAIPNGMSNRFVDLKTPIKKATGSERDIINPIENMMNMVNRVVKTAKYNEVGQSLLKSVKAAPDKLKPLAEVIATKDGMFSNLDNVVTVLEDGKPVYLKINDKPLLDMLNGLPKTTITVPGINRVVSGFKRLITQDNPVFAIRNISRDIPTYLVNGTESNPLKAFGNLFSAGKDIVTNSPNFQRYKALGGGGGNFFNSGNVAKSAAELTGKGNTFKNIIQKPIKTIEKFNNLTEAAPRLAEFKTVLKKTGSTDKALYAANDVTVNFSRGGDVTKAVDRNGVPYLNAGVQGLDKLIRQFKNRPIATILKGATTITVPTLILREINKNNPNYQQMSQRNKDNYYLIPTGDTFIKIPKSREIGVIFSALAERTLDAIDRKPDAFKGFGNTVATNFAPTNPLENNIGSPLFYNLPTNKDFAGRSIVPLGMVMDKRSPQYQYDETTSEVAKKMGELTKLSPKQIDYIIKAYTGVIGQLALPTTVKQNYQGGDTFQKLLKPLTSQFTADSVYSNDVLNDFYTNMDKLSQKSTDKNFVGKLPSKLVTPEEQKKSIFTKASSRISDINKQIRQETDLDKIRALKKQVLDIARSANATLK